MSVAQLIPRVRPLPATPPTVPADSSQFATYDISIGGLGFRYASDVNQPMLWETAPYVREQIDQAAEAGEQTLSTWWMKSQSSFHGGAGSLNLERTDLPPEYTHIRFNQSKNVDVWMPGRVTRLPDTTRVSTNTSSSMVGLTLAGADRAVFVNQAAALILLNPSAGSQTQLTGVTESVYTVATDGKFAYAAGATGVWKVDPSTPTSATKIASYSSATAAVVGWLKGRLMLGVNGAVYELDANAATTVAVGSTQLKYQHPSTGWTWRCFAESPSAILAAGDAGSHSEVVAFTLQASGATPVLSASGTVTTLPPGERVLAMAATMGSFLALGTTAGVRIAEVDQSLQPGPLTLPQTETQFPVSALACRDRFVYAGGLAVDEPGLVRIDLGTQTDQAGRYAWATDLVAPTQTAASPVTAVCTLPSGLLLFSVPSFGICYQASTDAGSARESWLQTSRIRYNTTEPKLFKLGRVRGDLSTGSVRVEAVSRDGSANCGTFGFTEADPDEFALPAGRQEWLALKFTLLGSMSRLSSYGVKALPGTKRQRLIQVTVSAFDRETDRLNHQQRSTGEARGRVEALFDLDSNGDQVLFEEYGIYGNRRTLVVVEKVQFKETGRPTKTSDFGGLVTVTMRTVQ